MLSDECHELLAAVHDAVREFMAKVEPFVDDGAAMYGREVDALIRLSMKAAGHDALDPCATGDLLRLAHMTVGLHDTAPGSDANARIAAAVARMASAAMADETGPATGALPED